MWFDENYIYRRLIAIQAPKLEGVSESHPVVVQITPEIFSLGKVREDLEDVEVTYLDDEDQEVILFREIEEVDGKFYVAFELQSSLEAGESVSGRYFVYYGNPSLRDAGVRPEHGGGLFTSFPVELSHSDSLVAYTRPGEHWKDGVSSRTLARMSVTIEAEKVRILSEVGPDKAIMEVQIDDRDWDRVDLRSEFTETIPVYTNDLDPGQHEIRVRVTGETTSYGDEVNVKYIQYRKPVLTSDLGEEVYDFAWSSSTGGT